MSKRQADALDKRIERLYYQRCNGVQISMLDIPKVFDAGRMAALEGLDDQALGDRIAAFVDTIRHK